LHPTHSPPDVLVLLRILSICLIALSTMAESTLGDDDVSPSKPPSRGWLEIRATVTSRFRQRTKQAVAGIPAAIRQTLRTKGWRVVAAKFVVDAAPDLKGKMPRGWPSGTTWSNSDAVHLPRRKTIIIAEKRIARNGEVVNVNRVSGVLRHEIGHAFDMALMKGGLANPFHSSTSGFDSLYRTDVEQMSAQLKRKLKYFTQSGPAGRQETFAEAFAIILGGGSVPDREKHFRSAFPRVLKYVRGRVKSRP